MPAAQPTPDRQYLFRRIVRAAGRSLARLPKVRGFLQAYRAVSAKPEQRTTAPVSEVRASAAPSPEPVQPKARRSSAERLTGRELLRQIDQQTALRHAAALARSLRKPLPYSHPSHPWYGHYYG